MFRNECLPPPTLGGPLQPFLTPEQFWPSIVFNPAAASAFLLGLPWHNHHHHHHQAGQPSPYQSSIHKALSQRLITVNQQWPAAAQTSSSEPHSPSSAASSTGSPEPPPSPIQEFVEIVAAAEGQSSPDRDSAAAVSTCLSPVQSV